MQRRGIQIGLSILLGIILIFCQMAPGQASDSNNKKMSCPRLTNRLKSEKAVE